MKESRSTYSQTIEAIKQVEAGLAAPELGINSATAALALDFAAGSAGSSYVQRPCTRVWC